MADPAPPSFDYDLFVIGGGSGGLACAKEAAKHGAKVALADFVRPSPAGTSWGLGGTCVNVGCIPKKLMHQASLLGEAMRDAPSFGWGVTEENPEPPALPKHDWATMVNNIDNYIRPLNFGYRTALRNSKVEYINSYAVMLDPHTVQLTDKKGKVTTKTAQKVVVAVGGRPYYGDLPGAAEHCITSDDIFWRTTPPGRTLVIGASYVALECAGFLTGLGYDTTVMVRSILLRGFDQQISEMIGAYMEKEGTKFIRGAVPVSFDKDPDSGLIKVTYQLADKSIHTDSFETVMLAVGRRPETAAIGLDKLGVAVEADSGKIITHNEQTNIPNIYAIGDCIAGKPELTPVAIQAGKLLARRLLDPSFTTQMDYDTVPTAVFTPLEYGAVGLPEEVAIGRLGEGNVEVFHSYYKPLEWTLNHDRPDNVCYMKMVVDVTGKQRIDEGRVVGIHILGPSAGEMVQQCAVAIKLGANKADFERVIGIHPTVAEEMFTLRITKRSGEDPKKTGC